MQRYFSNVYWHFTGSPDVDWNKIREPKEIEEQYKPSAEAVNILKKILTSHKLLATSEEKILSDLKTESFCCVCDIPFKDLIYHSKYYGKVAIGFSAETIHKEFNPVLYLENAFPILNDIEIDTSHKLDTDKKFDSGAPAYEFFSYLLGLEENLQYKEFLKDYLGYLKRFIKLTKFSEKDDETFYREREWRSRNGDFEFEANEVEAVIVPEKFTSEVNEELSNSNYNKDIPVIPFEFIEKV